MAFGNVRNLSSWGTAIVGSLALHVVVLGLVFGMRGCGGTSTPPPPPPPQTDGRATDLPGARPTEESADEPKVAETPVKPEVKKSAPKKGEGRKPEVKKPDAKKHEGKSAVKDDKSSAQDLAEGWKTYKVKPGDSLTKIARACGLTVPELAKANGISPTANLRLGQTLKIKDVSSAGE